MSTHCTPHTRYADIPAYVTKDGSVIRELMHPQQHGGRAQSLAEATVPPGTRTLLHRHALTEELYHVCLLYTSPSPRDYAASRMPSSA